MLALVLSTDSSKLQRLAEERTDSYGYCRHLLRNIRVGKTKSGTSARVLDIYPIKSITLLHKYSFIWVALLKITLVIEAEAFTIFGSLMIVMLYATKIANSM